MTAVYARVASLVIALQPVVLLKGALSAQGQAPFCDDSEVLLVFVATRRRRACRTTLPGIDRSTSARARGLSQAWSRFAAGPLWRMLDSSSTDSPHGRNDLRTPMCTVAVYANGVELCATRFLHIVPQKKPTIQFLVDHNRRPCHWFVEGYRVRGEEPSRGERVMRSALR